MVSFPTVPSIKMNVTDSVATGPQIPSHCPPFHFQGFLPWESPHNVISAHTEELVRQVKDTVLLPILFLIGGPANVINMAVFYRQGLKERINVCLFALSLSDFLYLLFNMILHGEQLSLHFTSKERNGPIFRFIMNNNLIVFYGFTWVSQILYAIIASERCFCILQPLRSQTVLSTSTTTIIIVVNYITMLGLYFLVATRFRLACFYDLVRKKVIWFNTTTKFFQDNKKLIDTVNIFIFGMVIPGVVITVVVVATVVTMVKLRQAAAWRAGTSSSSSVSSAREVALTVMLVYNSIFFIVCVFPTTLSGVVWLFLPEIIAQGDQFNLLFMCVWLSDIVTYINATFNFVIYYTMGSRYRQTFWQILGRDSKSGGRMRQSKPSVVTTSAASVSGTQK